MKPARKLLLPLAIALCCLPVLLFALLGAYSRPMSDDFCHISITAGLPFWEAAVHWRSGENGSYSNLALMSLLGPLGFDVARIFPGLLIAITIACYTALLLKALALAGMARHRLLAAFGLSALLAAAASHSLATGAALYWYTASVKYSLPLALCALVLLLLLHAAGREKSWLWAMAGGALCFATAGFAETFTMPMLLGLSLLFAAIWRIGGDLRARCLPIAGAGWFATVASMLAMLSAPGVSSRSEAIAKSSVIAARTTGDVLWLALDAWLRHMSDPAALASFTLTLAAGMMAGFALPKAVGASQHGSRQLARNPLLFAMAAQLVFLPLVWLHISDDRDILGRYSLAYSAVIVSNLAMVIGLAALVRGRRRADSQVRAHPLALPGLVLAIAALFIAMTQLRSIHLRAAVYLWASCHSLLIALAWQLSARLPKGGVRRFATGMGILYATIWLGTAAVAFAVNLHSKEDILRAYTWLSHFNGWQGVIWGVWLGWALRSLAGARKWLQASAMLVALWLGGAMLADNLALLPKFKTYAAAFDSRHQRIIAGREGGMREFSFSPLPYDLPRKLSVAPFDTHHCPPLYYDIDKIEIRAEH